MPYDVDKVALSDGKMVWKKFLEERFAPSPSFLDFKLTQKSKFNKNGFFYSLVFMTEVLLAIAVMFKTWIFQII